MRLITALKDEPYRNRTLYSVASSDYWFDAFLECAVASFIGKWPSGKGKRLISERYEGSTPSFPTKYTSLV